MTLITKHLIIVFLLVSTYLFGEDSLKVVYNRIPLGQHQQVLAYNQINNPNKKTEKKIINKLFSLTDFGKNSEFIKEDALEIRVNKKKFPVRMNTFASYSHQFPEFKKLVQIQAVENFFPISASKLDNILGDFKDTTLKIVYDRQVYPWDYFKILIVEIYDPRPKYGKNILIDYLNLTKDLQYSRYLDKDPIHIEMDKANAIKAATNLFAFLEKYSDSPYFSSILALLDLSRSITSHYYGDLEFFKKFITASLKYNAAPDYEGYRFYYKLIHYYFNEENKSLLPLKPRIKEFIETIDRNTYQKQGYSEIIFGNFDNVLNEK